MTLSIEIKNAIALSITISTIMLNVVYGDSNVFLYFYVEFHYAEYHYGECCNAECRGSLGSPFILSVLDMKA
jgi:hypothetical protein